TSLPIPDAACGPTAASSSTSIRLSGGVQTGVIAAPANRVSDGNGGTMPNPAAEILGTYSRSTAFSSDPALMGDQERIGLATMAAFFRRYVGNETAFDPYMTGELSDTPGNNELPATACPTSTSGTRIDCNQYLQTSYFAPPAEREDVITPDTDNPTTVSALGTAIQSSGFANPYTDGGGVSPKPATTATGLDWCNPEPNQFTPVNLGITGYPTADRSCPLPNALAVGGQSSNRESGPVNQSYGNQLSVAWNDPVSTTGAPAQFSTRIPAADGDLSGKKALALGAGVNYFDTRNPDRSGDAQWNPALTTQDFAIQLTDAAGHVATVHAGDRDYGTALEQTTGSTNARVHVILNQVRVPLADFAAQGLDLTSVRKIAFVFGGTGFPATGSIQLADIRFQESVDGPTALTARAGSAEAATVIADTPRAAASPSNPGPVLIGASAKVATTATACTDEAAPVAKLVKKTVKGGKLTVKGTAVDAGCSSAKGTVKTVQLVLARRSGKTVRYVQASGKLSKAMPTSLAPTTLVAKGTSTWSLTTKKLAKGSYSLSILSIDGAGNAATVKAGSVLVG
ncbi:MAG: alpha/beta hydrolase, partial [Solirubrobacteraceae bacterium]